MYSLALETQSRQLRRCSKGKRESEPTARPNLTAGALQDTPHVVT
jgi:hypothetical protein